MDKISVVVTTYNIEEYVGQCLKSVVDQDYENLEIIIVDDGSSDSTPSIIREFAERDSRIVPILLEENTPGGVATGANVGISKATGEWIGFVDGDDWCEPDMFSSLIQLGKDTGSDLVIGDFRNYNQIDDTYYDPSDRKHWLSDIEKGSPLSSVGDKKRLLKFNPVPWRKLYSSKLIHDNDIRYPEGDYFYEDNPFHWFCISKANSISLLEKVLCYHRMNRVGQTMSTGDKRLLAFYDHHDTILSWLKSTGEYDTYKNELVLWVINNTCWIYDAIESDLKNEVLLCLSGALHKHDSSFVQSVINSQNMGNKGRDLANRALTSFDQSEDGVYISDSVKYTSSSRVRKILLLAKETKVYYEQYGAKETARKIRQYLYARSPVKSKFFSPRKNKGGGNLTGIERDIKEVRQRLEFSELIRLLEDEERRVP